MPRKRSRRLTVLILVGLGLWAGPHQVLTRTGEVARALDPVLSRYEVIRMAPGEIERQVETTGELRLPMEGREVYFRLERHNLRGPNYRAEATGRGGVRRTLPPQPVHTFKGVLAGQEDTRGRFNLTDGGVEGMVYAPEGWVYVEPLRNYLPKTPTGELVVYRHADLKPGEAMKCGVSLPGRLKRGVSRVTAQTEAVPPVNYVADIATEADYEYVQALGGAAEANREIEGILNVVEGIFQAEMLVTLRLVFQHAWETEEDPYSTSDASRLLTEFRSYWSENFQDKIDYDLAHLWSGRRSLDAAGLAARRICPPGETKRPIGVVSGLGRSISGLYRTSAHEIGHNFGASHPNELVPPVLDCTNTIMAAGPGPTGGDRRLTFCQFSRQQMAEHLAGYNSCLETRPITLQPPGGLRARATSASGIRLAWQDNSANETGFLIERRRQGSGEWVRVGTTPADTTSFTSEGLFSEATYLHRVRAFNDSESSAYSNGAAATTLSNPAMGAGWRIETVAGRTDNDGDGGPAIRARLAGPGGVAVDGAGNIYIADTENHRIRRVDGSGNITTIAGTGERGYSGDGGPAIRARLAGPGGVAVDGAGNVYIADRENHRIRRVDASGIITTVAGNGEIGFSGDGGPAVGAWLHTPGGVAVDGAGNVYIADTENHRIRRVDGSGTITTFAGTGRGYGGDGVPAVAAWLRWPAGVAVDGAGNVYIADTWNHRIRRVDGSGIITTVAGTGEWGSGGDGDPAVAARLNRPRDVAVDASGALYIADTWNHRIRRVDPSGIITTVTGTGGWGFDGDGDPAVAARLNRPRDVAVDASGALYIADTWNHRIRWVDPSGIITTIAGIGESGYGGDGGPAVAASLWHPRGVAVNTSGNVYIADTWNHRIRRVDAGGTITTIAGTGESGRGGDDGPAVQVQLDRPSDVAVDGEGNLYIADTRNDRIRRVDLSGIITTAVAEVSLPGGVAVDPSGALYIAGTWNHRIRRVDAGGTITTIAGTGERGFSGDGGPATEAVLELPEGVAVGGEGNLYIADTRNHRIRRVDPSGVITTVAGIGEGNDSGGAGPATEAALSRPRGVAADRLGNLYIADTGNHRIRRVDPSGTLSTIAGTGVSGYGGDGGLAVEAQLNQPTGVAVDEAGNVYVADTGNHRIRILTRLPPPPPAPTRLRATAASPFRVDLAWRDNSDTEEGFRVQRLREGASNWVDIGTVGANLATYSDRGLEPATTYRYRVRAYRDIVMSAFSNEAAARTPEVMPPTLTGFTPRRGPAGSRVTLEGTHFHGATAVEFNGVPAARFEVASGTRIESVVPLEATSGPIRVVAPGGMVSSTGSFTVVDSGIGTSLFVPIVLRSQGRTPGSFFTSELTLTNRGTTTAGVHYTYRAAFGGGSGRAVDAVGPGRQRVIPDAMAYLRSLGVPIGGGSAGGTLRVEFSNLSKASDAAVTVRTATPVPQGEGRAGLAYLGVAPEELFTEPVVVAGLRQNSQDRSNLAVQNAGAAGEGEATLRVTVFSGDRQAPGSMTLPDLTLTPGGFHQYNGILTGAGFENGYARVERVSGTAPYYAYGVVNDNFNSDGSFVFPVTEGSLEGTEGQTLPVIVETGEFSSELTVTNFSPVAKTVELRFVAEAGESDEGAARFSLDLEAGEQRIPPRVVDWLREQGVAGMGPQGKAFAGSMSARVAEGDMSGIVVGARTGSPDGRGGQYGVFYHAVPDGAAFTDSAWIDGLQQNGENRSNLALVNTGAVDGGDSVFSLEIHDGETGRLVRTLTRTVPSKRRRQINRILGNHAAGTTQGYVRIRKISGNNPFLAYGVVNDGGAPGERSGDGAYLPARE